MYCWKCANGLYNFFVLLHARDLTMPKYTFLYAEPGNVLKFT